MVEEQVEVVVFPFDGEMCLPADESEAGAERDEELLNVVRKALLQLPLTRGTVERGEVEDVRTFQRLLREI